MNPTSFDRLAIRLSRRTTCRGILRALAGGALLYGGLGRSTRAQTSPFDGISLGGACTQTAECAQVQACNIPGLVTCADNGVIDDGRLTCCLHEGGFCFDAADCCAGLECDGGGSDNCGAGTCQVRAWTSRSAECDAYVSSLLAQIPASSAYAILDEWGPSTPDLLVLPAHCPWPALPPESPWCTPEYCIDHILLEHSDDGREYCYWYDPELADNPEFPEDNPGRRAKWRCRSLEVIAGTA